MESSLRESVLATLAYYDIFDYPLTEREILRGLIKTGEEAELGNIGLILSDLKTEGIVTEYDGYYVLFGREFLVALRERYARVAQRLWWRARVAGRLLMLVPFIRAIFISGSLAFQNTDELSDIDVLVVARSGRIWSARLLAHGLVACFGLRRKHTDAIAPAKICLNHFITDRSLEIPLHSLYNAQTYAHLVPLFADKPALVVDFFWQNSWIKNYVIQLNINVKPLINIAFPLTWIRKILQIMFDGRIGDWLERQARKYQAAKIYSRGGLPSGVIVSDAMLCFHPDSIEDEVLKKYSERLRRLDLA